MPFGFPSGGSASGAIWIPDDVNGGWRLSQRSTDGTNVPAKIRVNRGEVISEHTSTNGLELAHEPIEADTPGNNSGETVIGLYLSYEKDGDNAAMTVDAGQQAGPSNTGVWSRAMPIVITPANPVLINNVAGTTPDTITKMAMILIPNSGVFGTAGVGGEDIHISRAATLALEGAPDTSDGHVIYGAKSCVWLQNDELTVGDGINFGLNENSSSYIEGGGNGSAVPAPAGRFRIQFDPLTQGLGWTVDAEATTRPFPIAYFTYRQLDPGAAVYQPGDTVIQTYWVSNSLAVNPDLPLTTRKGFQSFVPARWGLPAAIAITGGNLFPWVRFTFQSGSTTPFASTFLNATAGAVANPAQSEFIGLEGWITKVDFMVRNDTLVASPSSNLGLYQIEGSCY